MINPLLLLKGDTLGKTIYNTCVAIAFAGIIGWVGFGLVTGRFWHWRANVANARADRAEGVAEIATANADSANKGAANATVTREAIDAGRMEIVVRTEQSARRAENYEPVDIYPSGDLPPDLMRELEEANAKAGAAANRLQRTRPR